MKIISLIPLELDGKITNLISEHQFNDRKKGSVIYGSSIHKSHQQSPNCENYVRTNLIPSTGTNRVLC